MTLTSTPSTNQNPPLFLHLFQPSLNTPWFEAIAQWPPPLFWDCGWYTVSWHTHRSPQLVRRNTNERCKHLSYMNDDGTKKTHCCLLCSKRGFVLFCASSPYSIITDISHKDSLHTKNPFIKSLPIVSVKVEKRENQGQVMRMMKKICSIGVYDWWNSNVPIKMRW